MDTGGSGFEKGHDATVTTSKSRAPSSSVTRCLRTDLVLHVHDHQTSGLSVYMCVINHQEST